MWWFRACDPASSAAIGLRPTSLPYSGSTPLAIPRAVASGESGIRLVRGGRLPLDSGTVALRGLIHGIGATPVPRAVAASDGEYRARPVSAPMTTMVGARRAMQESHCRNGRSSPSTMASASPARTRKSSWSFSRWYIAIGSPGPRTVRLIPSCRNPRRPRTCALELAQDSATCAFPPLRRACVEDEPAFPLWDKSVFGRHELRLRNHQPETAMRGPHRAPPSPRPDDCVPA